MIDEKIKEIHSIKNEINKINNIINNNIIFSPINQKIKYKEDKNLKLIHIMEPQNIAKKPILRKRYK